MLDERNARVPRANGNGRVPVTSPTHELANLSESVRRLSDGMSRLVRDHIALARMELANEAKVAARDAAFASAGIPAAAIGYLFVMIAIAIGIGHWVGLGFGFAIVGGLHLVAGALLTLVFGRLLADRDRPSLTRTTNELREDGRWWKQLRS